MVDSRFTPGGGGGITSYQGRQDYEYNNLKQIEGLAQEVITDKTLSYHDSMFKLIIIGDSGKYTYFTAIIKSKNLCMCV